MAVPFARLLGMPTNNGRTMVAGVSNLARRH
jgi:hypothetical protein